MLVLVPGHVAGSSFYSGCIFILMLSVFFLNAVICDGSHDAHSGLHVSLLDEKYTCTVSDCTCTDFHVCPQGELADWPRLGTRADVFQHPPLGDCF